MHSFIFWARARIAGLALLVVLGATTLAVARPRPRPRDTSAIAFSEGQQAYEQQDWDTAIEKFKLSYKLRKDPVTLLRLGQAYQAKGDCQAALDTFQSYKKAYPKAKNKDAVEGLINTAKECVDGQAAKDQPAKDDAAKEQAAKDEAAKEQAAKDAAAKEQADKAQATPPPVVADAAGKPPASKPTLKELDVEPGGTPPAAPGTTPAAPPAPAGSPGWNVLKGTKLSFYGMLRVDAHYTDSAMNDPRFPMWALSTGNHSYVQGMDLIEQNKNPTFVMHPRLSRFGMDAVSQPIDSLGHATLTGKLEFDFFAGENESRALPRLRHVYGKLAWGPVFLLFGQTTDVISPLIPSVNAEAVMWNAGNLGDRQPQIQIGASPQLGSRVRFDLQLAAGQEGARTNADLDNDGNLDGDLAGRPQLQGRAGVALKLWADQPINIGAWAVDGKQRLVLLSTLPQTVSQKSDFTTFAAGADVTLPITSFLVLQGEVWQGRNLADLRGGIGQLIDIRTGTEVRSMGGWGEVMLWPVHWWRIVGGMGIDHPNADDVQLRGERSLNQVMWVGNLFTAGAFSLGLDYSRWHTEWVRLNTGKANRYSLSLIFSF